MSQYSDHNDGVPSSIVGISDTGALGKANGSENFVATAKRQGYQTSKDAVSYLALITAMGPQKLYVPFANTQINDWREGDLGPRGMFSAVVINTFLDELFNFGWRKDPNFASLKPDFEAYLMRKKQAAGLMQEISMTPDAIQDYIAKLEMDEAA